VVPGPLRLALDVNFPESILSALAEFVIDVELVPVRHIDPHLSELDDRPLMFALRQEGFEWLVTNNYRMLRNPQELAAIIAAKINIFAIEAAGDDPLRATGALLLDLPGTIRRAVPGEGRVFWSRPRNPEAQDPMTIFGEVAKRLHMSPTVLLEEVAVSDAEINTPWRELVDL
jgi:hypothetical protein